MSTNTYWEIVHDESCDHALGLPHVRRYDHQQDAEEQHNKCMLRKATHCRLKRVTECELRTQNHIVVLEDTDRWWLRFLHDRLVNVHKESPNIGYMHILRGIIATVPVNATGYKLDGVSVEDIGAELDDSSPYRN